MTTPKNTNLQTFIKLLETASAITVDDGFPLVGGFDVSKLTGDADNEVVRFMINDDSDNVYVFSEGGISNGVFMQNGDFVCEDHKGEKSKFTFFALKKMTATDFPTEQEDAFSVLSQKWAPAEKEHALKSMGNEYEEEIEIPLKNGRIVCCGSSVDSGQYIRIVESCYELAIWNERNWRYIPADVMAAVLEMLLSMKSNYLESSSKYATVKIDKFDNENNACFIEEYDLEVAEISDIINSAIKIVSAYRSNEIVGEIINELDEHLSFSELIDQKFPD